RDLSGRHQANRCLHRTCRGGRRRHSGNRTRSHRTLAAVFVRRRRDRFMTEMMPADNNREVALVDLLDRVLAGGVVISGDITLSMADVDLVVISLRTLVSSVGSLLDQMEPDDAR